MVYNFDDNLRAVDRRFIGDQEEIKKAMEDVAAQGKQK